MTLSKFINYKKMGEDARNDEAEKTTKKHPCTFYCPMCHNKFNTEVVLLEHIFRVHTGVVGRELVELARGKGQHLACPEAGCDFSSDKIKRKLVLAAHLATKHRKVVEVVRRRYPGWRIPGHAVPEDKIPDVKIPGDKVPDDKVPEDKVPGDKIPDDKVPDDGEQVKNLPSVSFSWKFGTRRLQRRLG